jgi:hypothetical protein
MAEFVLATALISPALLGVVCLYALRRKCDVRFSFASLRLFKIEFETSRNGGFGAIHRLTGRRSGCSVAEKISFRTHRDVGEACKPI